MSNVVFARNFKAEAAVPAFTIFKLSATTDGQILPATGPADALIGVSTDVAALIGERCDGILLGPADVLYGAAVTRGQQLTSDANGRAVPAAPAAGVNNNTLGRALVSGVLGDIGQVMISIGTTQG